MKLKNILAALLAASIFAASCSSDFLDTKSTSAVDQTEMFTNTTNAMMALQGLHKLMYKQRSTAPQMGYGVYMLWMDFMAEDFKAGFAQGLRFILQNEGPYLIHCNEGKDRAGFTAAVLECLMGASADEVIADYMTTYENYYGVAKGSDQYAAIARSNIEKSLSAAFEVEDIRGSALAEEAEAYLTQQLGLTPEEVVDLKVKLAD